MRDSLNDFKMRDIYKTPIVIGFLGLIPFIFSAISLWIFEDPWKSFIFLNLINYCIIILSFLGAIHWGIAIREKVSNKYWYIWSISPALVSWIAIMGSLDYNNLILLLLLCFLLTYFFDFFAYRSSKIPLWYLNLRKFLTIIVLISLSSVYIYLFNFKYS